MRKFVKILLPVVALLVASAPVYAQDNSKTGTSNGHEYVDLGLPSGLKWATCSYGASSPTEPGEYISWGEMTPKSFYNESNSKTYEKRVSSISATPTYDVVAVNWGGNWRMPTADEMRELVWECQWEWTREDGKPGYKVTGPNGNTLFFPAIGYRSGPNVVHDNDAGYFWTGTPADDELLAYANCLFLIKNNFGVDAGHRYRGFNIRPVCD